MWEELADKVVHRDHYLLTTPIWKRSMSNDLDGTYPGFQGHSIFDVEYLKTVCLKDKVAIEH